VILKLTLDLLGRHIRGRTYDAAGERELRGQAGDAKVAESDSVFRIDENVSGFDVGREQFHARWAVASAPANSTAQAQAR